MKYLAIKVTIAFLIGVLSQNIAVLGEGGKRVKKIEYMVVFVLYIATLIATLLL